MKVSFLTHSLLILFSTLIPFVWTSNSTTFPYTLQLCGGLIIAYIVFKKVLGNVYHENGVDILTVLTANSITQLLILSTGGSKSSLFFLYYFLIFAFSIVCESYQSITISLATVLAFLYQLNFNADAATIANLFSLLLISPLAQSFSKTMINNLESQGKIKVLENNLEKEESDSLLWLTTEAKPTLNSVITSVTDLVIFLKSSRHNLDVPKNLLDKVKSIQADLITLYSSTDDLEETLKESSDSNKI